MATEKRIELKRFTQDGVTLIGSGTAASGGVTFCFTERTGGVSQPPFSSLNLGLKGGDDPACVLENRRRVLCAMGASDLVETLALPNQTHGSEVAVISKAGELPQSLTQDADAVVCTVPDQAVMLLVADCTPVVLTCPGGFALVHSGWRGTLAGISGKAARVLATSAGADPSQVQAFIGPHISGASYEVSQELLDRFVEVFGQAAVYGPRHLDLGACVRASLEEAGVPADSILDTRLCTAQLTDRFFSHRAEMGKTGRHAAVAFMRP